MAQHAGLSPERWAAFTLDQQIIMIANEMNRAAKLMAPADRDRLLNGYERVLDLTNLTIVAPIRAPLRRELLRWRDLIAALYVHPASDARAHAIAFRALLLFTPQSAALLAHHNLAHHNAEGSRTCN